MDWFFIGIHEWMVAAAERYAQLHPEHRELARALPYFVDVMLVSYCAITFGFGLAAQWRFITRAISVRQDADDLPDGYVQRTDGQWMHERRDPLPPFKVQGYDMCDPPLSTRAATIVRAQTRRS